jgi:hypothetical protein
MAAVHAEDDELVRRLSNEIVRGRDYA